MNNKRFQFVKQLALVGSMLGASVWAQPTPAPTTGDAVCGTTPVGNSTDTLVSTRDGEGYYSLFNGKDFTGWWLSCQTGHGGPPGPIFRVDTERKAIYSTNRSGNIGGILMTKKKFGNYEIVFDYWPDYGNDGGIFHRTSANGNCFQTVLDYLSGSSLGGTWGEGSNSPVGSRDIRPFTFSGNENTISVNTNPNWGWTNFTNKDPNKTLYGCPTGCGAADWTRLWDVDNWNQIKIQFYGGLTSGTLPVRMKSFVRKTTVTNFWVPISADTTVTNVLPESFIGLQVHGGGAFNAPKGTWYRNMKWKPLDDKGFPKDPVPTSTFSGKVLFDIQATMNSLIGKIDSKHEITIYSLDGKAIDKFSGGPGKFQYEFKSKTFGWLSMKIKTSRGTTFRKLMREHASF